MRQKMRYFLLLVGLLLSVSIGAQTVKWRDIYTVKKKDTIFGIANKYGLSLPELMDANPEMKREGYMLQKGATLFIPYTKDQKNPNQVNGQKFGRLGCLVCTASAKSAGLTHSACGKHSW